MADDPNRQWAPNDEMERWEAEQADSSRVTRDRALANDAGMYEPPADIVDDEDVEDLSARSGPWYSWSMVRLAVVIVLAAIVLILLLRACTSRSTPAPGAQTTPVATLSAPQPTFTSTLPSVGMTTTVVVSPTVAAVSPTAAAPVGGSFQKGQQVKVGGTEGEGIRFRTGPGLGYTTTAILQDDMILTVVGGPEQADGYTWWRLQTARSSVGWATDGNLTAVQP